jgi:hypothetical protein
MSTGRFTLAAVTVAAVLAATTAAVTIPGWVLPCLLTWCVVYVTAVMGAARLAHLPAGRVLVASALMLATTAGLLLTALRAVIDQALHLLQEINTRGLAALSKEVNAA